MGCFYIHDGDGDDDASTNNLTENTIISTTLILSSLDKSTSQTS